MTPDGTPQPTDNKWPGPPRKGGGGGARRGGHRPPPHRKPARRPGPTPARSDPKPARPPQRAPARKPIADDPAAELDLTTVAIVDLRLAEVPEPELVGALKGEATTTPTGMATTDTWSSLPRMRDDDDQASEPTVLRDVPPVESIREAFDIDPAPSSDTEPLQPERQVWPEVRFYLGCAALFFVTFALATGLWVLAPAVVFGWSSAAITSGSMAPAIQVGDVVVFSATPEDAIGVGTVIVFEDSTGDLVTHRIADVDADGTYVTRGDNNPVPDSQPVSHDEVRGIGRLLVPFAGYPAVWMASGSAISVLLVASGFGLLVFACRWALLPRFSPWPRER